MLSPQGYNIPEPSNTNPFWGEGEDQDVNRIYATAEITGGTGTPSVQTSKTVSGHDITFGFNFHNLKGRAGDDGVSPTVTVTDITGGHRLTITDESSTHTIDIMDGQPGAPGAPGEPGTPGTPGSDGVSPDVSVTNITGGHRVTITDATGSESFDVMDGQPGTPGTPGTDGVSPTVSVTDITGGHRVTITDATGSESFDVLDGTAGSPGTPGTDGVSPTIDVVTVSGGHRVDITDAQGSESFTVLDGTPGTPGSDGVTPDITMSATADATSSANPTVTVTKSGTAANPAFSLAFSGLKGTAGSNGQGVPAGGTAGQVLQKVDGTDYNTQWATPSGGGGSKSIYYATPSLSTKTINMSSGTLNYITHNVGNMTLRSGSGASTITARELRNKYDVGKARIFLIMQDQMLDSRRGTRAVAEASAMYASTSSYVYVEFLSTYYITSGYIFEVIAVVEDD